MAGEEVQKFRVDMEHTTSGSEKVVASIDSVTEAQKRQLKTGKELNISEIAMINSRFRNAGFDDELRKSSEKRIGIAKKLRDANAENVKRMGELPGVGAPPRIRLSTHDLTPAQQSKRDLDNFTRKLPESMRRLGKVQYGRKDDSSTSRAPLTPPPTTKENWDKATKSVQKYSHVSGKLDTMTRKITATNMSFLGVMFGVMGIINVASRMIPSLLSPISD